VLGAAPGVGKSTLCAGLAASFPGLRVDHFREEEILSRPSFAEVATEFRGGGPVRLETLLAATASFVTASTSADVVIADSLFPYVPSLRAWGHPTSVIAAFLESLSPVVSPVVLYLDGDPAVTLPRAATREAPGWLDWFVAKLAAYPGSAVHDLPTAVAYLRDERDLTLRLLADWDVHVIPDGAPDAVLSAALSAILPPGSRPPAPSPPR
jgi:hypothetical protein